MKNQNTRPHSAFMIQQGGQSCQDSQFIAMTSDVCVTYPPAGQLCEVVLSVVLAQKHSQQQLRNDLLTGHYILDSCPVSSTLFVSLVCEGRIDERRAVASLVSFLNGSKAGLAAVSREETVVDDKKEIPSDQHQQRVSRSFEDVISVCMSKTFKDERSRFGGVASRRDDTVRSPNLKWSISQYRKPIGEQ
ncbi:hypothetical protein CHARACLAT_027592 [Characodon lateralis]|uniref:Uncharacterized protein n=1 Tax=Characodon lateralis TaxID=208331 RepID=A0ABU7E430_9TELE|nr:hypothetical protein [Characodon lateralis]